MRAKVGFMHKIVGSRTLRTVFSILFIVNTVFLVCAAQSFSFLKDNGFYATNGEELQRDTIDRLMVKSSHDALIYLQYVFQNTKTRDKGTNEELKKYQNAFSEKNSNFFFRIIRRDEVTLEPTTVFETYIGESGYSYYPKSEEFFTSEENANLIESWNTLSFEGHLKKTLTAHDAFWRADRFFFYANELKYAVLALLILTAVLEGFFAYVLYSAAGHKTPANERDLDHIPLYLLIPFYAMFGALCVVSLMRQAAAISDLVQVFSGADLQPAIYTYFLLLFVLAASLQMLLKTVSLRLHRPLWWRYSILYRTFAAHSFSQRARTVLSIMLVLQFASYYVVLLILKKIPSWVYLTADGVFTVTMALLLYVVWKDMTVYIPHTRRIASEGHGYVPTDGLSDSGRRHAENINFLSRSANAETEKRYVNESFSTKLIHSVSYGLRDPLQDVAENVRMLEEDDLTAQQARQCTDRILSLSQELKKTIEDMILISKAATGNLPFEPVPTDAGMMLSQAVGEFGVLFEEKGIEPVTEQPDALVMIRADGQYMWYVFEGILSVMLENAVAGTRLFLQTRRAGENAVIVFRCTVHANAAEHIHELSGMGLSSAKVFTMLQDGVMAERLSHDTLTAVLQFPAVSPDN